MLDLIQLSDLWKYKDSMPECKEKQLLNSLLFEYEEYIRCGTPEECKARLEWMSYSLDDVRRKFTEIIKGLQEEVEHIRSDYQPKPKSKRRGRPPKEESPKGVI